MTPHEVAHIQQAISKAKSEAYLVGAGMAEKSAEMAQAVGKTEVADAQRGLANVLRLLAAGA